MNATMEITLEGQLESRIAEECDAMEGYGVGELKDAIRESISSVWDACYRIAAAVRLLQRAGEDLSFLREGWGKWALLLAKCKVLPETLKTFAHMPITLNAVAAMPLEKQAEVVKDEPVEVLRDGTVQRVKPTKLRAKEITRVLGKDGPRSIAEQKKFHTEASPSIPELPIRVGQRSQMTIGRLSPDLERHGAFYEGSGMKVFFPLAELERTISFIRNGGLD